MKKLILSAAVLAITGLTAATANTVNAPEVVYAVQDSVTKKPIKLQELPEAVKATLVSPEYKEWIPSTAFLVRDEKGMEYYQVDVKKVEELKSLKFSKEGKLVE